MAVSDGEWSSWRLGNFGLVWNMKTLEVLHMKSYLSLVAERRLAVTVGVVFVGRWNRASFDADPLCSRVMPCLLERNCS